MVDSSALWRIAYVLPNLLAASGMAFVAFLTWRYRTQRGGMSLWLFAVGAAVWAFFEGVSFVGLPGEYILFAWHLQSVGSCLSPLAMAIAIVAYFGHGRWLTQRRILLLATVPLGVFVATWTNPWHGLVWKSVAMDFSTPIPTLAYEIGPVYWVYFAYIILLLLMATGYLLLRLPELSPLQRRQACLMIYAALFPFLTGSVFMIDAATFGLADFRFLRNMSLIPMSYAVSAILLIVALRRERLFELAHVTAHEIYRSLDDAVFVLDDTCRVLDFNDAAARMLPAAVPIGSGQPLARWLPQLSDMLRQADWDSRGEITVDGFCYDVRLTVLRSVGGRIRARLLVARDVTERKRLEAELQRLALTDPLTGLYNRRHFGARGDEEIEYAKRYGRPLSLILVDIDYFKEVNDRHGHEAGDRALVALAGLISSELRVVDCIGRIGGEEFALLLPETDAATAREVGARVIDTVQRSEIALQDGRRISLTVSIGIASLREDETAINALLGRADAALYEAKHKGRNRLVQDV